MTSHSKEQIGEIFAMIIESVHELVAPETIKPVIGRIIENFVTEQCPDANITVGLNAIREILMRQPLALDEATIEYLCEFRSYRNKSVMAAARSLINFFREVCPTLLPKKMLGRDKQYLGEDGPEKLFGEVDLKRGIDGADLLKEGDNVAADRILTDTDLKKIKVLKLRKAMRRVDRGGFKEDEVEGAAEGADEGADEGAEEGEEAEDEYDDEEMGESDMEEYGEEEMSESDEDAPELIPIERKHEKKQMADQDSDSDDSYMSSIDPV
jgi:protein SDA1